MTRLKSGITAIFLFLTALLHARADTMKLHEAKMQMLRAAVGFYSSDPNQSGNGVICNSLKFSELRKCAGQMANVNVKLNKWYGMSVGDDAALHALADTILKDITEGDGRARRKKLKTYPEFKDQLARLSRTKADPAVIPTEEAAIDQLPSQDLGAPPDSLPADSPAEEISSQNLQAPPADHDKPVWESPLVISLTALGIAIAALIITLLKRRRRSSHRSSGRRSMQPGFGGTDTYAADQSIAAMQRKIEDLDRELGKLNQMIEELESRLVRKIQSLDSHQAAEWPKRESAAPVTNQFPIVKKWAKNVDGGGFSIDALAPDPDDKMIYEITQTGRETATFKVSDAREAQLFALSNPQNYLREGCTYTTQPAANSQIRTEAPGTLSLEGRKWRITKQAAITFT